MQALRLVALGGLLYAAGALWFGGTLLRAAASREERRDALVLAALWPFVLAVYLYDDITGR